MYYHINMIEDDLKNKELYISQMERGLLLNPRLDSTFQALFTRPTQESHEALISFLEAATENKIKSIKLLANNAPQSFIGQRGVSYDILCEFDNGLYANIEMQAFNQHYDYGKRAEYQVARLETTYLKKGDDWAKAPKVYQITVLDFNYNTNDKKGKVVSRYAMRTQDGRELTNNLNIIFIELPKTEVIEDNIDTNTSLENWAIFLKSADNPNKKELIKKLVQKEKGLMQAQESLSTISTDRDLWIEQYRQEIFERDRLSAIKASIEEGLQQGMQQGMQQGAFSKAKETAKNLLKLNILSIEQIADATGLTIEEVKNVD